MSARAAEFVEPVGTTSSNPVLSALFLLQRFGWLLLIGGIVLYLAVKDRMKKRHLAEVFDPERVARLEEERRRKLDEQAARLKQMAAAQDRKSKEAEQRERKEARKFASRVGKGDLPAPRDAKSFDTGGPGSGRGGAKLFGIQNRYPSKCGPSGG